MKGVQKTRWSPTKAFSTDPVWNSTIIFSHLPKNSLNKSLYLRLNYIITYKSLLYIIKAIINYNHMYHHTHIIIIFHLNDWASTYHQTIFFWLKNSPPFLIRVLCVKCKYDFRNFRQNKKICEKGFLFISMSWIYKKG